MRFVDNSAVGAYCLGHPVYALGPFKLSSLNSHWKCLILMFVCSTGTQYSEMPLDFVFIESRFSVCTFNDALQPSINVKHFIAAMANLGERYRSVKFYCIWKSTGWPKNRHTFFYAVTSYALASLNVDRFSNLFHCQNQENIWNNTVTKHTTTPQVCRYTTL